MDTSSVIKLGVLGTIEIPRPALTKPVTTILLSLYSMDVFGIKPKLSKINIQSWNYKSQDPSIRHIGITAQDFYSNFGFGENNLTLTWIDVAGINSVAIQELIKENEELKEQLIEVNYMYNSVIERLNALEKMNQ